MRRLIAGTLWVALALAIIDTGLSLALTCHEQSYESGANQNAGKDCSALEGPLLAGLVWLVEAFAENSEAVIAAFTIVLAISTIALWLSTRNLWQVTQDTLRHSEKTAERQLRAYFTVTTSEIRNFHTHAVPQAHIVLKNTGQTPAYDVTARIGIGFGEFRPNDTVPEPPRDDLLPTSRSLLGPGGEHHLVVSLGGPISNEQMAALAAKTHAIQVMGGINYRDAFGQRRWTTFNQYYGGSYGLNPNRILYHAPHGNDGN